MTFWYSILTVISSLIGMAIGMFAFAILNQGYWCLIAGREYAQIASFPRGMAGYRGMALGLTIGPVLVANLQRHTEQAGKGLVIAGELVAIVTAIIYIVLIALTIISRRDSVEPQPATKDSPPLWQIWPILFSLISWEVLMWILATALIYWGLHTGH